MILTLRNAHQLFNRFQATEKFIQCKECHGRGAFFSEWNSGEIPDLTERMEEMRRHLRDKHQNEIRSFAHGRLQEKLEEHRRVSDELREAMDDCLSEGVTEEEISKMFGLVGKNFKKYEKEDSDE